MEFFIELTIETVGIEFRLPLEKIAKTTQLLITFSKKKKITLKEMQSLLGLLAFATRILPIEKKKFKAALCYFCRLKKPFISSSEVKEDM